MTEPEVLVEAYRVTLWPEDLRENPEAAADAGMWSCTVQYQGGGRWSVDRGGFCLNRSGAWDLSLSASDRPDEWLVLHRFTREEALIRAKEATGRIIMAGLTTGQAIAHYRKENDG